MLKYVLLIAIAIAVVHAQGQCNPATSPGTCQDSSIAISWSACPPGQAMKARAYYGRRDKTTCIAGKPYQEIQFTECYSPGNEDRMSQIVTDWCNSNTEADGSCQIEASNGVFGDPCLGTYKYLKICTYCDGPGQCNPATSPATCEDSSIAISWSACPPGQAMEARAYYGRRDRITCIADIPYQEFQITDCYSPGNEDRMSQTVTDWCNSNTGADGTCLIEASSSVFGDPCLGTYKYMKICTYCERHARAQEVLILLDVSESFKDFLSQITGFLQTFYSFTTEETFFQNHNRKVTVALFNEGLSGEQWVMDYSKYASVTGFLAAETQELNSIITTILNREATGRTNIGQTLLDAKQTFSLDGYWKVIMVSDFINMFRQPLVSQVMDQYDNAQIRTVPVIVDKQMRDEDIYNAVRQASLDNYGIDLRSGFGLTDVNATYNLGSR